MEQTEYYNLVNYIVETLFPVSANDLPSICSELGLAPGTIQQAMGGKRRYLRNRIEEKSSDFVLELGEKVADRYSVQELHRLVATYRKTGVRGKVKNLIFAATGYKHELVFSDSISNDIKIVKYEEFCLVYDEPFPSEGLRWPVLAQWYAKQKSLPFPSPDASNALYVRLLKSIGSPPEKNLFTAYYKKFAKIAGDNLPALIPQVYLHYDPKKAQELNGERRVPRHRMDFLLLLSHSERIVLEVDGKQHYSESNNPSPRLYGEMVSADRDLKLAGYDVYRFGGSELQAGCDDLVEAFFRRLFKKHGIKI